VEFTTLAIGAGPNPVTVGWATCLVHDYTGAPQPNSQVSSWGGFTGLNCGFSTDIRLHRVCDAVEVTLVHFAQAATVEAYNTAGALVSAAAMSGPQKVAETLKLTGPDIVRLIIRARADETLLLRICCSGKPIKEKIEKIEKPELKEIKEHKEKPEKREIKDWKDKPEKREHKEKPEIKETVKDKDKEKEWPKELKDLRKEKEGLQEGFRLQDAQSGQAAADGSLEERVAAIEAMVGQLAHFIQPEYRPDLGAGALSNEPNTDAMDVTALGQQLAKDAADAKQAKDNKDIEKLAER
jgi:outer membrane biosynthesis protein TonB